jgi:putative membrane protein
MWQILVRWLISSLAVAAAAFLVPGISHDGSSALVAIVVTAAILGLLNAVLRPILRFLSCGLIVATLGFFLLVVNAFVFWLSAQVSENWFHTGFRVDGFWPAFWGAIVISLVSFVLSMIIKDRDEE